MSIKFLFVWTFVTVALSAVVFVDDPPKPEVRTETKTVTEYITVTKPAPPAQLIVPDACIAAAELGRDLGDAALDVDRAGQQLIDYISESRVAIVMSDYRSLNDIETVVRKLRSSILGEVEKLTFDQQDLLDLLAECESAS